MAMGKRRQRQEMLFIMPHGLPKSAGHPFYQKLNALLAEAAFDRWIEKRCQRSTDPESRITQLKDGRTRPAYKEHVVDLKSDVILAAEIYSADHADTQTLVDSVLEAVENVQQAGSQIEIEKIVADKGYHASETIELADDLNFRTYIRERRRPDRSRWTDKPADFQQAVSANRRRLKRTKSRRFHKLRSERVERTFAHVCDTGGMRRSWSKEDMNVSKRSLIAAGAHNLGRIMRKLVGVGKPRTLQDLGGFIALAQHLVARCFAATCRRPQSPNAPTSSTFAAVA